MINSSRGDGAKARTTSGPPANRVAEHWEWQDLSGDKAEEHGGEGDAHVPQEARRAEELAVVFERGLQEGRRVERAELEQRVNVAAKAAQAVLEEVAQRQSLWEAHREENLAALATAVARQIVDHELSVAPEFVSSLVKKAVTHFPSDQTLKVRVHPDDLRTLTAGTDALATFADGERVHGRSVRWATDDAMARGGCVVEGPKGIVDGRVDAALERIYWRMTRG